MRLLDAFTFVRLTVHALTPAAPNTAPKVRAFVEILSAYLRTPPCAAAAS